MLAYQIKIALKSLRRNPILSTLLVLGIALGIAVSTAFVTIYYLMAKDPIPYKSDKLFNVQMDSWNPERPFNDNKPEEPPRQMTFRDVEAIMESDIPTYKSGMYKAHLTVHPEAENERPYRATVRMCFADFFPMFEVPFQYGSGWGRSADANIEPVVVLNEKTNQRLFGGENSVGRKVRIFDREFTVVGVTENWRPMPKFYDVNNFAFDQSEEIYMPLTFSRPMEIDSAGNDSGWGSYGDGYEEYLLSESTWLQMWVQLDDHRQREEYQAYLDAYALEQRKLGRFERPLNNRLRDVMAWMKAQEIVPDEAVSFLIIGTLFLIVCSVNLIGLLLGKFLARGPEVGVRRALGASKSSIFIQHLVECELIGVMGGLVGLGLSVLTLEGINSLFTARADFQFALDLNMVGAGVLLSLVSGMIAGLYPAWRICRIEPAAHLKTQ